jgi:hypothetical protein
MTNLKIGQLEREPQMKAIKNTISEWGDPNMDVKKILNMLLIEAFVWNNAPEGFDYWTNVNKGKVEGTKIVKVTGIRKYFKEIELDVVVPAHLDGRDVVDYIDMTDSIQDAIDNAYAEASFEYYLDSDELTLDYE